MYFTKITPTFIFYKTVFFFFLHKISFIFSFHNYLKMIILDYFVQLYKCYSTHLAHYRIIAINFLFCILIMPVTVLVCLDRYGIRLKNVFILKVT